jgi:hypothetical protein
MGTPIGGGDSCACGRRVRTTIVPRQDSGAAPRWSVTFTHVNRRRLSILVKAPSEEAAFQQVERNPHVARGTRVKRIAQTVRQLYSDGDRAG